MGMDQVRFLENERIYLNPIAEKDIPQIVQFANEETSRMVGSNSGKIVYESKIKERMLDNQKNDEMFGIYIKETDEIIGDISLHSIDKYNRSATLSMLIGNDEYRNRGYGKEAIVLVLKHAFIGINLESVNLGTWGFNNRAIHVYEKVGFKVIGRKRNARIVGNKVFDEILMDIISKEYFELYGNKEMEKLNLAK
jgi:RimJ/RimL family protein N-acetyltransferase